MKKKMIASIFAASLAVGALTFQYIPALIGKQIIHVDGAIPFKDKTTLIGESDIIVSGTVNDII
ncbi:hypothetical protein [Paenibacillus ferrarius]|uniref:hypothetical protein n=1 Tax=Paenibacillus ferrarius TaxID=1469647 RepID=UPI003D2813D8